MEEASSNAADKSNDGQQPPAEDSDEDLCDVAFPIIDNRSTANGGGEELTGDDEMSKIHKNDGNGTAANILDEHAVMRCFGLSVNAHVEGGAVATFEPMPPKNEGLAVVKDETTKTMSMATSGDDSDPPEIQQQANVGNGEWFPSSLPLPSWAKNIP